MGTATQRVSEWPQPLTWLQEFLKEELAPYSGRGWLVTRMVTASTLVMIVAMTFQMPYGAYGAIYALTISRENPETTLKAVKTLIFAFMVAAADVLVGAVLFSGDPNLRLIWVFATLFLSFYALSALADYSAAARFGYLIIITIPLWDSFIPTTQKVEQTLWAVGTVSFASIVTVLLELAFAQLKPSDDLTEPIAERLMCVEELLNSYTLNRPVEEKTAKQVTRLSMLGTSRIRRILQRGSHPLHYAEQMGTVVALVARLIDISVNLIYFDIQISSDEDRRRIRHLAEYIADIRTDLVNGRVPRTLDAHRATEVSYEIPLLNELVRTTSLIPEAFTGSQSLNAYAPPPSVADPPWRLFVQDAFTNPEHLKFGLKGSLAAILCYITYNLIAWPGISTSITTCLLTALSTIGASHQKQVLRFAGAIVGGVLFGFGAQVFILPALDTIGGFTVLFIAVMIVSAWCSTSTPRLSYFGNQVAVAFCLINLQEFKMQTSLAVVRDRVAGIFLGLFMMWLVFDQLWGAPSAVEMKRAFVSSLRLLAQFARGPVAKDTRIAIERNYALRETINNTFEKVRSFADGVWFEFGASRQQDLVWRSRILHWQPLLRSIFLTRITLLKYRLNLPGFELPAEIMTAQQDFDEHLGRMLDGMADRVQGKTSEGKEALAVFLERLESAVQSWSANEPKGVFQAKMQIFLPLSRRIESLAVSLDQEI